MRVVGYANEKGKQFAKTPEWTKDISFHLPPLDELMRKPEKIIKKFENASKKFRRSFKEDFNGDGISDLALMNGEGTRVNLWLGRTNDTIKKAMSVDSLIYDVFFADKETDWDLDRLVTLLEKIGSKEIHRITRGRAWEKALDLRDHEHYELLKIFTGDIDGDKRAEIVAVYNIKGQRDIKVFDLWRLELKDF